MLDVSVIIPVCNVEKYLAECLDSVLSQENVNMEIICVNDGSSDDSLDILRKYESLDHRLIVIDKVNTGYGDSMNCGLKKAQGKYIAILESDDVMVSGILYKMLSVAEKSQADLVKGNYCVFSNEVKVCELFENLIGLPYEQVICAKENKELFLVAPSIWSSLYRRSFLLDNKIAFLPTAGAAYQDTSFAFKTFALASRIVLLQTPVIFYRQDRNGSSSNTSKKVFEIFKETNEMERFVSDNRLDELWNVLMVAEFRAYKWNLDRLNVIDKQRFLMKMHCEYRRNLFLGHVNRELWRDYDWIILNNILFNPLGYKKAILKSVEPRFQNEAIYELMSGIKTYILSGSREGEVMLAEIWEYGADIEGYINNPYIFKMPSVSKCVIEPGEIDKNSIILISQKEPELDKLETYLISKKIDCYVVI